MAGVIRAEKQVGDARPWRPEDPLESIDFTGWDLAGEFLRWLETIGRAKASLQSYRRVLNQFQAFLNEKRGGKHIGKATREDVALWKKELDDRGLSEATKVGYFVLLNNFYRFLVESGDYPHRVNPVWMVKKSMSLANVTPLRREVTVEEMGEFVRFVKHPRDRALIVLLLKTGMRRGECANLRLGDIALDEVGRNKNPKLRPRSVLVEAGRPGTKRRPDTLIPIDEETVRALKTWLAVRPRSESDRLFVELNMKGAIDRQRLSYVVQEWARKFGWWSPDADLTVNVTPHFFRHFFTTQMRVRGMSDAVVSYIRGDSAKDIKDVYTHLPWEEVRAQYDRAIYKFGI